VLKGRKFNQWMRPVSKQDMKHRNRMTGALRGLFWTEERIKGRSERIKGISLFPIGPPNFPESEQGKSAQCN
jgi:hypothetical protein